MSAVWLLILLAALITLSELTRRLERSELTRRLERSELTRRLERTDLRVYLRSMPSRTAQICPVCRHVLYAARCYCPERTWEDSSGAHFHSIGYGVTFPCTDERCPEGGRRS